jgi:hypothetical protein
MINKNEVKQDMLRVYIEQGKLTYQNYNEYGKFSCSLIQKKIGKFSELKKEVTNNDIHYDISKEDLSNDVLRVYKQLDGKMTKEDYIKHGKYSRKPIERHYKSWNKMLETLNLNINCLMNISEEELINELKRLYNVFGCVSATMMKKHGKYSTEVYQRRMGSFNNAVIKAGIPLTTKGLRTSPIAQSMIKLASEILKEEPIYECEFNWLKNPQTKRKLYVDAVFFKNKIAFEYNGPQHYMNIEQYNMNKYNSLEKNQHRDRIKKELLLRYGYKVLIFKYDEPHTQEYLKTRIDGLVK